VNEPAIDVGDYCRRVEEHLARVNEGQIVRIVGPAFELVRGWALEGIPISLVFHGIDMKAGRHRAGRSKRPLRLEFCEADVREVFDRWRRAVGLTARAADEGQAASGADAPVEETRRQPSLSKHLERAIDRLSRASGRLDLPDAFRDLLSASLDELAALRDGARSARGEARATLTGRLPALDAALLAGARAALPRDTLDRLEADAAADLAPYRSRLSADAWQRSLARGTDQLIRDHLGLPTIDLGAI
jgi:hypothetical protein